MTKQIRPTLAASQPAARLVAALLATAALPAPAKGAAPAESPETAGGARVMAAPAAPLKADDRVGPIVLSKMPVLQVIELLQTYSGRVVLPGAKLPKQDFTFKSDGTLRRDEAILALETLLSLNGIMLVKQGDQFLRAVPQAEVLRSGPGMLDDAAPGDQAAQQVFGKIFALEHLDSNTMFYQVRGLLSSGGVSTILNLSWRDALLIFDTAQNLEAVGNVIAMLDQPPPERAEVFIVPVKNSSVNSVYQAMLHAQRTRSVSALGRASFHVDRSANHLVVVARPGTKAYIEELVGRLDEQIAPLTTSEVFPIRKGNIRTIHSILQGIIRHQQTWFSRQGFQSADAYRRNEEPPAAPAAGTQEGAAPAEAPPPSVDAVVSDLSAATAELQFSPYMTLWIDYQNNAIVAYGTSADMQRAAALIAQLDRESAPYTSSEIIPLRHASAPGISGLLNHMVNVQRGTFAREGQASGEARAGAAGAAAADGAEDAFEFSPYMYIWAERAGNSVLVYGTRNDIDRIKAIIQKLDVEQAPITRSKTLEIKHTQATTCASLITRIIEMQRRAFMREGLYTGQTRGAGAAPGADLEGAGLETGFEFSPYALVTADRTGNALFIYGTERDIARIEELVGNLDRETVPVTASEIIPLRHASAPGISGLLNRMVQVQRTMFSREGRMSGEARTAAVEGMDDAFEFSPYMYIWGERAGNTILVYGTRGDIDRIKAIIQKLDVEQAPITRSKTVDLKHTQATTCASLITRIIEMQRRAFTREGLYTGQTRDAGAAPGADLEGGGLETGFEFSPYALVTADHTGNALFLYGTRRDIERIEELVANLDRETAPITRSKVYYLAHADANSLSRIVSQVIASQRAIFRSRGLRAGEKGVAPDAELLMGFEFSDFATVVADRRSNSILLYGTETDIARVDEIIRETDIPVEPITASRVIALKHAEANNLSRVLQIIITSQRRAMREVESAREKVRNVPAEGEAPSPGSVEGDPAVQFSQFLSIVPDARNNALIVYGTHGDLGHVATLVKQMDVEVAPLTRSEALFLENARASTLASILTQMIRGQQTAMRQVQSLFRAIQYPGRAGEDEAQAAAMMYDPNQPMQFSPYVSVVANDRNNTLLVYGTSEDINQLRTIVAQNDIAVAPRTQSRIFLIKHADANDVVRTINPLITSQQRVREREATLRKFFRPRGLLGEEAAEFAGFAEAGAEAGPPDTLAEGGMEFDDDLQFSPYVTLAADNRSNSVIVYGTPFDLDQVQNLIEQIDRILPQVQIEVVIAEVLIRAGQVTGLSSFGLSFDNPFPFQVGSAATGGVLGRGGIITSGNEVSAGTGNAVDMNMTFDPFSLQTVFRVAKEDSDVRVLSAPTITTTHNRPASINVGEARPIITGSATSLNSANLTTRSEVEYRDIGIELKVRPLVSEQGFVQLDIEQVVETVIDTQTIDNNEQPIIGTRRANSFVSMRNEQILVMGGLQSESTITTQGKVWLLGDIPLLGRLFRPTKNTSQVRELIIFIRPTLVESMDAATMAARQRTREGSVAQDIVTYLETGSFAGQNEITGTQGSGEAQPPDEPPLPEPQPPAAKEADPDEP